GQGKRLLNSSEASNSYSVFGVEPPESETRNGPGVASAACVIHSAASCASASRSGNILMRPIALPMCLLPRRSENECLHRVCKTSIVVESRDRRGLRLDLVRSVTHGDAEAGALEHQHVVWLIADGRNLLSRHADVLHEIFHHGALVRVLVGHV